MGGLLSSVGNLLGVGGAGQGKNVSVGTGNSGLDQLGRQNSLFGNDNAAGVLQDYSSGKGDLSSVFGYGDQLGAPQRMELMNALASGATTGSKFATEQVQNNPILGQLFGQGGALSQALAKEQELQKQGFQLTPQDTEAYGQASGNISRLFGQSEQGASQSLARRGLASAPSGAAGAMFSGLQGNKNEMLAKAQMDISNQRMQNTMQRIGQQQQYASQLGAQGSNAIQQQYARQSGGAEAQKNSLTNQGGLENQRNQVYNQGQLGQANFAEENRPQNVIDTLTGLVGGLYGGAGGGTGGPQKKGKDSGGSGGGGGAETAAAIG